MDHEHNTKHSALIQREDELLEQIDTCQQMLEALWRFLRSTAESIHTPTVRHSLIALRIIERHIDDKLLYVRLKLLPYAAFRKSDPSLNNNALG